MTIRLAHSTWGMPTVPIDEAVSYCARLGFDGLEMTVIPGWPTDAATMTTTKRRQIRQLFDDHQLALCGLSGATPLLTSDQATAAEHVQRVCSYLDLAAELQRPGERLSVSTVSGGTEADWAQAKHELAERYGALARHAEQTDTYIGMEPHIGAALHLPEQALWLIEQVGSPALRVHLDISHFTIRGLDMVSTVKQLAPYAVHTHVKDERGRAPDHEFLIPGEGEMEYVAYLQALAAVGYDGYVATEISLAVQRRTDYDPFAAAAQSYAVLAQAFATAGLARQSA